MHITVDEEKRSDGDGPNGKGNGSDDGEVVAAGSYDNLIRALSLPRSYRMQSGRLVGAFRDSIQSLSSWRSRDRGGVAAVGEPGPTGPGRAITFADETTTRGNRGMAPGVGNVLNGSTLGLPMHYRGASDASSIPSVYSTDTRGNRLSFGRGSGRGIAQ